MKKHFYIGLSLNLFILLNSFLIPSVFATSNEFHQQIFNGAELKVLAYQVSNIAFYYF